MNPCTPGVAESGNLDPKDADALINQARNRAKLLSASSGKSMPEALKDVAGEMKAEAKTMGKIYNRNQLLDTQARLNIKNFAKRFTQGWGEGLHALLVGTLKTTEGGRNSIDYQTKANHAKYFGALYSRLSDAGVLRDFKKSRPEMVQDIYREMGAMEPGKQQKSVTNNKSAFAIAQAIDSVYQEMVARQNRAGAYINRVPGYIIRQTHDMSMIRALGAGPGGPSKERSFSAWNRFTLPLLDLAKTFDGASPLEVMPLIHEALYTGVHGPMHPELEPMAPGQYGSLATKLSKERVLWFKDADSAYKYNQAFGIRNFKEAVLQDIHNRARSISILENLGPRFEANFHQVIQELQQEARSTDNPDKHIDSLNDWKVKAAFNEVTGKNEFTANPTLSKFTSFLKVNAQLSKMGAVLLSKMPVDFAAVSAEMRHQGLTGLQALGTGLMNMVHTSPESKKMAMKMGVGIEALIGNLLSSMEEHSTVSGWTHTLQKWFYSMTGLPRWNDAFRNSVATLMGSQLGDHAHMSHEELPGQLRTILSQYDITPSRWDALRSTVYDYKGSKFISPDMVDKIPADVMSNLVTERGLTPTDTNIQRERDSLETALRTYFSDRADIAVPTPGAAERLYMTYNTQAGTPVGEALRLAMTFKSFPITMMRKIAGTQIYGNGANSFKDWLLHDNRGKFNMAMNIALMTAAGYVSLTLHDLAGGKTPRPIMLNGKPDWDTFQQSAAMGGSMGLISEALFGEFEKNYKSYAQYALGPILGQADDLQQIYSQIKKGKNVNWPATKLVLNNTPFANLFYIRPILNYLILWNLQEMMSPGSLERMESRVETQQHQGFFIKPSEHDKR